MALRSADVAPPTNALEAVGQWWHEFGSSLEEASLDERLELARVVAAPGCDVIRLAGNEAAGWLSSLSDAVKEGCPYFVNGLTSRILACDIDNGAEALHALVTYLSDQGISPVVVRSGRKGHFHAFARIDDPGKMADAIAFAKPLGKDFVKRSIRPPLTPSQRFGTVRLVWPLTPREAVRFLSAHPGRAKAEQAFFEFVRFGPSKPKDRSGPEFVACQLALKAGLTFEECRVALLRPENKVGAKTRERSNDGYLRGVWRAAEQRVAKVGYIGDRAEARREIEVRRRYWEQQPFPGPSGAADRAVLNAIFGLAEALGTMRIDISVRQVADDAGIGKTAAANALRRLADRGCIYRVKAATHKTAARYRIEAVPQCGEADTYIPSGGGCIRGVSASPHSLAHDAFRRGALGKRAGELYALLLQRGPLSAHEISERLGISRRSVWEYLRRLREQGLAGPVSGDSSWVGIEVTPVRLDQIAEGLGSLGAGTRARERFALERKLYEAARFERAEADALASRARPRGSEGPCERDARPVEISPALDAARSDQAPSVAVTAHVPTGIRGRPGLGLAAALLRIR